MADHLSLKNSISALIVISVGFFCPLSLLLYHGFVRATPRSIEESAVIDGCSGYNLFFRIVFPLLKPITGTLIVVNFVRAWNEFLLPLILISRVEKHTIPLSQMIMYSQFTNNRWNLLLTGGVLAIVPILIVFLFAQKFIIRGLISGAVKE
ncbi:MAG TPA: carbohydrate ABC transporter permease, partial [Spirochaetia bacterium]|nr:carbohydrate ABC transporter permease [Spirochaetia bacterium]